MSSYINVHQVQSVEYVLCGLHAVFWKTTEDGSLTYYNRVFGGRAEVMRIILPLTELLTVPGHAGSRSR